MALAARPAASPACAPDPAAVAAAAFPTHALIQRVEPGSPADDVGLHAGCYITSVDGSPLRDVIDWRWLASDDVVELGYVDTEGDAGTVEVERDPGTDWGIEFEGLVFDDVIQCRNACTFCFMHQLPRGMRPSLYLRDDDFRLSFLVGTFVTLTNLAAEDEARIIEQRITPLHVSLQATTPEVRRRMIGRRAQHGIEALDRLLDAGIEAHAQIVLVPGQNDGDELTSTLTWCYERPGILTVGVVPLGYTRFQKRFERSFEGPDDARALLEDIAPFQRRAQAERGTPWVFAADEFYANAFADNLAAHVPPAAHYGSFSLFEDGIGIIRSFLDDWQRACADGAVEACARALRASGTRALLVAGCAQRGFLTPSVESSALHGLLVPLYVENEYFGGNVNVTGLLVGADVSARIKDVLEQEGCCDDLFLLPRVMFNDHGVMLDDLTLDDVARMTGARVRMVSCSPIDYLREIEHLARCRA
ncbi:DUF512 domain-containing protein [Eggerthellaceae bacterium zg-1084]|uniref:DUF512 domain-containing protein n=1 Tax=Berryella wangjianweii TaxID=2734634 RepID=A0A6M8J4B2_9ACTN|nr:DUF512 domain-containing protein [Berryella wangjianweii]NPD32463.1 DUF512 domain-containing protein [Eggerthellaceae bacterium zg-997]QKF07951.1 DUF512 domain-containing protein [Berryella wangjianweii]